MEEKIEKKIEHIIEHIISKPVKTITLNDYTILHEELKDIRFRKTQAESDDRFKHIMAGLIPATFNGFGESK